MFTFGNITHALNDVIIMRQKLALSLLNGGLQESRSTVESIASLHSVWKLLQEQKTHSQVKMCPLNVARQKSATQISAQLPLSRVILDLPTPGGWKAELT